MEAHFATSAHQLFNPIWIQPERIPARREDRRNVILSFRHHPRHHNSWTLPRKTVVVACSTPLLLSTETVTASSSSRREFDDGTFLAPTLLKYVAAAAADKGGKRHSDPTRTPPLPLPKCLSFYRWKFFLEKLRFGSVHFPSSPHLIRN